MWQSILENVNVSNAIGVIGILIGYYLYAKAKPFVRFTYIVEETSIISVDTEKYGEKLDVVFDGKAVPRVTAARLLLWNTGNSPIEPQDFLANVPMHIAGRDGVDILNFTVLEKAAGENVSSLSAVHGHPAILQVKFDVIRPREGFLCEILHTGARGDLGVGGSLRRSARGIQRATSFMDGSSIFGSKSKVTRLLFPIFMLTMTLLLIVGVYMITHFLIGGVLYIFGLTSGLPETNFLGGSENIRFYGASSIAITFAVWAMNDAFNEWRKRPAKRLRDAFAQTR